MAEVYLDNSATTCVHPQVAEAIMTALRENYGNPSSAHRRGGQAAEQAVKKARRQVAWILRAEPGEIYFTSGGAPKATTGGALAGTAQARVRQGGSS